jgi:hypothetical protein
MGLTCATLHLFSPDASSGTPALSLGQLAEAVGGRLGYERIDNPEEAERHLITAVAPPWVSFFDVTNPGAITDESVDLGKQLSTASHRLVLLTSVLDSDAFAFLLFEKGKQVDGHASTRGLLPGRIKRLAPERRAQEWSRLFGRPISLEDVQSLTEKGMLFADDLLLRLCGLVGLSRDLATSTPRDLQARPWPNQQEFYFRSLPGAAGGLPVKQTVSHLPQTLRRSISLGGEDFLSFQLNGPAGAFVDPVLEFSGPAVDAGLVALSEKDYGVYGLWALGMEAIRAGDIRRVHAVNSSEAIEGQRVLRACLKGLSAERIGFVPRKQSILTYWSALRGIAVGEGEVRVSFLPNASAAERLPLRPALLVEVTR